MTAANPADATLRTLAQSLAEQVCQTYRLDPEDAAQRIIEIWSRDAALLNLIATAPDLEKAKRTRVYKDAVNEARKKIYFALRKYAPDQASFENACAEIESLRPGTGAAQLHSAVAQITEVHVSTAERLPHLDLFLRELIATVEGQRTVLDIGCGVLPLLFPFDRAPTLQRYVACDRDALAVRAVNAHTRWRDDNCLTAMQWDVSTGWEPIVAAAGAQQFDVAFMLKLLPVINRQQPDLLRVLGAVPAARIVVSGSKEALAKRNTIARREMSVINKFLAGAGFAPHRTFETPDEIVIIAQRTS